MSHLLTFEKKEINEAETASAVTEPDNRLISTVIDYCDCKSTFVTLMVG